MVVILGIKACLYFTIEAILALEVKNVVGSKIKIKDQNHRYFYLRFFGVLGADGTGPMKA